MPSQALPTLRLVRPSPDYLDSYLDACRETWGHVHEDYILHDPAAYGQWRETIFDDYAAHERGERLPDGFVPSATFWLVCGSRYIGTVNIRLRLSDSLRRYGGSIGGFIRLSERCKGYGTEALRMALDKAGELQLPEILICCRDSNAASRAVIEKFRPIRTDHSPPVLRYYFTPPAQAQD